jgi:hypothetical protein
MGNVWTVARQTIAEGVRMKIAVFFVVVLGVLVLGLPFAAKGDNSVSGAVQSFLAYSITAVTFLLSCLTIFLAKSLSDDLAGKQILMLMTKPLARWQYIIGKWLGIVLLNTVLLTVSGLGIYGLTRYVASRPAADEWDKERLANQVLVARHGSSFIAPDFAKDANELFERYQAEGRYATATELDERQEKDRIRGDLDRRWRSVWPGEGRVFEFEDVRCARNPENLVHVKYEAKVFNFPPDEVLRCEWRFGDPAKNTATYRVLRRDVIDRRHTIPVPADAVAADNTLTVTFINANPFTEAGEPQFANTVVFEGGKGVEVLFPVSTFGSNLVRTLALVLCRLAFLAALAITAATVFSFPVAVLAAMTVFLLAVVRGFLSDALMFVGNEGAAGVFTIVFQNVLQGIYLVIPDFSKVNALPLLVDGRNVTLKWVLFLGLGRLVLIQTSILLLLACLLFQRREVSEVSV